MKLLSAAQVFAVVRSGKVEYGERRQTIEARKRPVTAVHDLIDQVDFSRELPLMLLQGGIELFASQIAFEDRHQAFDAIQRVGVARTVQGVERVRRQREH